MFTQAANETEGKARQIAYFEKRPKDQFEAELQFIFIVLIAVAVYFELLGMHSIIAGFLVGLTLSDSVKHRIVASKLQAISYGLFIPIFFLVTGAETDLQYSLKPATP